jgi:phytoene synthase
MASHNAAGEGHQTNRAEQTSNSVHHSPQRPQYRDARNGQEGITAMSHAHHSFPSATWLWKWPGGSRIRAGNAAQQIMATHARTSFNFAARFLPPEERRCATDLYAFFRTLDDLVDETATSVAETDVRGELHAWRTWLDTDRCGDAPREPLGTNLARVIERCGIGVDIFHHMLDGLEADLVPREIKSDAELQTYCYQVASTVGYAMAHVLGATSPAALSAAEKLGAAMQLTNILRDVGEDLAAGRVYLPQATLDRYGLSRADLERMAQVSDARLDERYRAMMRAEIARAEALYDDAMPGIWLLPTTCRLPILIASRLYRRLLTLIAENDYDNLRQRAATTGFQKAREAAHCYAIAWRARNHIATAEVPLGASLAERSQPIPGPALDIQGD